jgi:hypothetical protein
MVKQKIKLFFYFSYFDFLGFKPTLNQTKSGPDHLRMYNDRHSPLSFYPIMELSLVDDARTAYDYGLSSTPPTSNDFSFVDQRVPMQQQTRQTQIPTHHSWFGTPNQQHSFLNRTFSMPQQQQTNLFSNNDSQRMMEEQQQMAAAAMLMHQQQNWARQQQQMFPMQQQQQQQQPQQFEQVE